MSVKINLEQGERYSVSYRCRDIGYGVEEGEDTFVYQGRETFGKLIFEPVNQGPPIYLFEDEIVDIEPREQPSDVWEMLEEAPIYASDVAELYHWSTNYDAGKGPFTLFLDLIGWTAENVGDPMYTIGDASGLGYVELYKLGKALVQYSDRPQDVINWVDAILSAEVDC